MSRKILFVDDEKQILSSLKRMFIDGQYEIYTADSGLAGLELLNKTPVDIIVSDQRMPGMSGVEFLEKSKKYSPGSFRIVLTGYADINDTMDAINRGEVYKYITKPWNDYDLRSTIRDAFEIKKLKDENQSLVGLTQKQNLELKDLNENLMQKVHEQTKELEQTYSNLETSFVDTVRVLSNLVRLRISMGPQHLQKTAELSRELAEMIGFAETDVKNIEIAALLHDMGKIGMSDKMLSKPYTEMGVKEKMEFEKHPVLGDAALASVKKMDVVSSIVKHHHELWDGSGYPDKLSGQDIPVGSRLISVVNDFDALMLGTLMPGNYTAHDAMEFILDGSDKRYDPTIVPLFADMMDIDSLEASKKAEIKVKSLSLEPDAILSRNIFTEKKLLLLNKGTRLTDRHINKIIHLEKISDVEYDIYIYS